MELLTLEHFAGCLNEVFHVSFSDGEIDFTLVEATPLAMTMPGAARAPFSLVFRNPSIIVFPQMIYRMRHERAGAFEIFLVPIGQDRDGSLYQAVFN